MGEPLWVIERMPVASHLDGSHHGRLRRCDDAIVRIQIDHRVSEQDAMLIAQQFAGILTPFGLLNMMTRVDAQEQSNG